MERFRYPAAFIVVWVLTMISLPIVRWTLGGTALQRGIVVGVMVQVGIVLLTLLEAWGWGRMMRMVVVVLPLAWLAEFLGSNTGFPFGRYHYTEILQPQIGGVPVLIPIAWLMMLPPAWAVADCISRPKKGDRRLALSQRSLISNQRSAISQRILFSFFSALAFTAWDLFLDPQMVAWNFWQWEHPGGYFGIPWVNFLGWLFVSGGITALVAPRTLPIKPLLVFYGITWLLQAIGQLLFWGLPGPGVCGFWGMGGILFIALWRNGIRNSIVHVTS